MVHLRANRSNWFTIAVAAGYALGVLFVLWVRFANG
jgi:hypothetical protein